MSKRCLGCMEQFGDEFTICPHCGYVVGSVPEEPIHMLPGTILHDRYIIGKVLGFGGFGVTYVAWDGRLEQKVAIKEYLPGEFSTRMPGQTTVTVFNGEKTEQFHGGLKKFVDEAKRLAKFQNESGIVKIFDSFEENKTAYIVMEYLQGETLSEYLKKNGTIPEEQAVEMMRPIMESLITVHEEGLLHRDIAPDNIFLTTSGEVKLIDFGASRYATTTHSRSLTVIVKPGYSPEEQYRSRGDQGAHTDVYAVAATLYKMITGKTPPDAMERRAKYENQNKDILIEPHKITKNISVNREIAILNALNVRIEDRTPDIVSFIEELNSDPPAKRRYGKIRKIDVFAWPLWLKITVPSVLVLLVAFGALLLTGVISFSKYTREVVIPENIVIAPDVEGLEKNDALNHVSEAKLLGTITGSIESEYIAAGKIIIQRPVGGTFMEKNGTINLVVSEGSGVAAPINGVSTIPYLIGNDRERAIEKCRMAGLGEPIFEEVEDEEIAAGLVISADFEGGDEAPEGTVLHIKISKGPAPFAMPETVGRDEISARTQLEDSGLMYVVEYEYSDTVPEGQVIRQSVPATKEVRRGDKITLVVSTGEKLVEVGNVVGRTQAEAEKILGNQGFAVYVRENTDEKIPKGAIISQSPEANSSQKKGSTITIFVSLGKKEINVSLDPVGGEGVTGEMVIHLDETYKDLPTPSRKGYTFDGWFTGKSGGSIVSTTTQVTQSSDHTLYAHWTANKYTVTLNENGGTVSPSLVTVSYDSSYSDLPTPSRTGYTFEGWYNGTTKITSSTKVTMTSDHTLEANWSADSYNVSFNANGGTVSSSSKSITFDSTYGSLPSPSFEGYIFTGWYTKLDGGSLIESSTTVSSTSDHTLYAHWSAGNCKVTLNPNGGTIESGIVGVTYKETYGEIPAASRTGYSFAGWFTDASGGTQVSASTQVTKTTDHTLYAHWTPVLYTLTFDGNGGAGDQSSKQVAFDATFGELPSATRDYYDFDGWYTSASGGTKVTSTNVMSGDVTVYAHWKIHPTSDWVLASDIPAGAQIVEEKWTYTQREEFVRYMNPDTGEDTADGMDLSDWTFDHYENLGWGKKHGPTTDDPSGLYFQVTEEQYEVSRTTHYRYYHRYGLGENVSTGEQGYVCGTDASLKSGTRHEIDLTNSLDSTGSFTAFGVTERRYGKYKCPQCGETSYWFTDGEYDDVEYGTRWYWQEPIENAYYYRDVDKESTEDPSGLDNVSNIKKYVKYREK